MEAQMLQERMREVEDRVDDFMRSYAGQTPLMRRIILNRLIESGHVKASVQPVIGTRAASSVRKSATRKTASKTRKTTAKRRVGGSSTRSSARNRSAVNSGYSIATVVGTRAWLRPAGSSEAEVIVGVGDAVAGSRVKEVSALNRTVTLENGRLIR